MKTPKGWTKMMDTRNELIWHGNVRDKRDFDIIVVLFPTKPSKEEYRGKWFVDKQGSNILLGKDRHLGSFKTRNKAISRAMKYMRLLCL